MNWSFGLFWLAVIWGAIVGALTVVAFIQERGISRVAVVGGWFGAVCLGVVALGAVVLLAVGVL